ncbi:hypothetical protein Trydic_g2636 [Trypoxylus dichotomus]
MKAFALAIFCVVASIATASWQGGAALVAPSAYGGAVAGGHGPAAVIAGPSGSVSTSGLGAWNGVGWVAGYGVPVNGLWNAGYGLWNGARGGWSGSGYEGQWIPDINEKLYDDGSYRPEYH